jgi:hypothetical protein
MGNFVRVFSDDLDGKVFTKPAFDAIKDTLCNGNQSHYETKEISSVEIGETEKVIDIEDLPSMGYSVPLTEQSDDELLEHVADGNEIEDYE